MDLSKPKTTASSITATEAIKKRAVKKYSTIVTEDSREDSAEIPLNGTPALSSTTSVDSSSLEELPTVSSTPLASQDSSAPPTGDTDQEKSFGALFLSAQQQREHRLRGQRLRALKAAGKYNTFLNHQRFADRRNYFDLQTNCVHIPRRIVQVLPADEELSGLQKQSGRLSTMPSEDHSGSRGGSLRCARTTIVSAYPVALMFSPPQFTDRIPMFTPKELGYFPLNSAIHHANPYAVQCLNMTEEQCKNQTGPELGGNDTGDADHSDGDSLNLSDEEGNKEEINQTEDGEEVGLLDAMEEEQEDEKVEPDVSTAKKGKRKPVNSKRALANSKLIKSAMEKAALEMAADDKNDAVSAKTDQPPEPIPTDACYICYMREKEGSVKVEESDLSGPPKKKHRRATTHNAKALAQEDLISCSTCMKKLHPSCAQLPKTTLLCMQNYSWECTDCKICLKCKSSEKEDRMMFCDLCDRGYHSFCVGVQRVPHGRWLCEQCAVCHLCGSTRPNEEGKRGRACIWQIDCDEDDSGSITAVRSICYRCYKERRGKKGKATSESAEQAVEDDDDDEKTNTELITPPE